MTLLRCLRIWPSQIPQCLRVRTFTFPSTQEYHVLRHEIARPFRPPPGRLRRAGLGTRTFSTETEAASIEEAEKEATSTSTATATATATSIATNEEEVEAELKAYGKMRLDKMQRMIQDEEGILKQPFPRLQHRGRTMTVADFLEVYRDYIPTDPDPKEVTLYGRIRSKRRHGIYLIFLDIVNQFETIQAIVNFKKINQVSQTITKNQFKLFLRFLERGDHISITGRAIRSSTNQLTIEASALPELLAPALEAFPEKLIDPEARAQRRHQDLFINPEVADTLRMRSAVLSYLRQFFDKRDFLEAQTPILEGMAGGANARPFVTVSSEVPGKELSLRIAPELWLKRLVVGGVHRVYEIGPAFRNEGVDHTHNPEFTMCEFYAAFTNLGDLIRDTETMISGLAEHCHDLVSNKLKTLPSIDPAFFNPPYQYVEFVPILEQMMGIRLPDLSHENSLPDLIACLQMANIYVPGGMPSTLPKLLDRLSAMYLEPLSFNSPLFIMHHPACMSPLSKSYVCPTTGQVVSARAELFVQGRELANMYEEENDPDEQLRKMVEYRKVAVHARERSAVDDNILQVREDSQLRRALDNEGNPRDRSKSPSDGEGGEQPPFIDYSYIRALRAGLPPTGGWGCGVERLVMLFTGARRISDCMSFGSLRHVVNLNAEDNVHSWEEEETEEGSPSRVERLTKKLTLAQSKNVE